MESFVLDIAEDLTFVKLQLKKYKGLTLDDVLKALTKEGVTVGIDKEKIEMLINSRNPLWHTIAEAKPPIEPIDDKISFQINLDNRAVEVDGRVNYREKRYLKNISKMEKILKFTPGGDGVNGKFVDGSPYPFKNSREIIKLTSVINKENIGFKKLSNGEFLCYSLIDGAYYIENGKLFVTDSFTLNHDLDYRTGNLSADSCSIVVNGDLKAGFSITTGKDLIIKGALLNGSIECFRLKANEIKAGDNPIHSNWIVAEYLSSRRYIYSEKIEIETIHGSELGSYTINSKLISHGKYFCKDSLIADQIGSVNGGTTTIVLGLDKTLFDRLIEQRRDLAKLRRKGRAFRVEVAKCSNEITELRNRHRKGEIDHNSYYPKFDYLDNELTLLKSDLTKLESKEDKVKERIEKLEARSRTNFESYIEVKKLYPGTIIRFGYNKPMVIYKEYENIKIVYSEESGMRFIKLD